MFRSVIPIIQNPWLILIIASIPLFNIIIYILQLIDN